MLASLIMLLGKFSVLVIGCLRLCDERHHEFRRIIAFTLACITLFSREQGPRLRYLRFLSFRRWTCLGGSYGISMIIH